MQQNDTEYINRVCRWRVGRGVHHHYTSSSLLEAVATAAWLKLSGGWSPSVQNHEETAQTACTSYITKLRVLKVCCGQLQPQPGCKTRQLRPMPLRSISCKKGRPKRRCPQTWKIGQVSSWIKLPLLAGTAAKAYTRLHQITAMQ